jgi:hypothetical protein
MENRRGAYRFLVGRPKRTPLGTPRRRWEDNIKIYLQDVNWIDLAEDRDRWRALVNAVMKLRGS